MKQTSNRQTAFSELSSLFTLLLFLVFVLCALFTIMIGSRVYAGIQDKDSAIFGRDTSVSYIKNKVRQGDQAGQISVRDMDGTSVLCIADLSLSAEDTEYVTYIYAQDGWLKELFTSTDSGLTLADGIQVMECEKALFSMEETEIGDSSCRLLTIRLDEEPSASIRLMSAAEGGNR